MAAGRRVTIGAGFGLAALAAAGAAWAGGCNCKTPTPPPPPTNCDCKVPNGHNVWVPGVNITPPSVSVSASATAEATATASASASSNVYANTLAAASASASSSGVIYNGGGSNWYVEQGSTGVIPNLEVEGVESGEARRICAQYRSAAKLVAIQAVCLDDKSVPHPASQVLPDRDVVGAYEGELYRCIAGARMQYTMGVFAGTANFDHGQTITCEKNQALYHSAGGGLACRLQKPARDCNERSLLRRYGAGIKVLTLASARECVAYRTEVAAGQSSPSSMALDGGVGGVVH